MQNTDMPDEYADSFNRAVPVDIFDVTPEGVREFAAKRSKKAVSIYLSIDTIEKFKKAAKKEGSRYQTMISNVLDVYTEQYL